MINSKLSNFILIWIIRAENFKWWKVVKLKLRKHTRRNEKHIYLQNAVSTNKQSKSLEKTS